MSIRLEVQAEESASEVEGGRKTKSGYTVYRSSKLVKDAKIRDGYTCQACAFYYKKEIVQVHHLDPLSERSFPQLTSKNDLVTLCPNCHYLAHHLLRRDDREKYKVRNVLINKIRKVLQSVSEK